jgi:hypothetical protein
MPHSTTNRSVYEPHPGTVKHKGELRELPMWVALTACCYGIAAASGMRFRNLPGSLSGAGSSAPDQALYQIDPVGALFWYCVRRAATCCRAPGNPILKGRQEANHRAPGLRDVGPRGTSATSIKSRTVSFELSHQEPALQHWDEAERTFAVASGLMGVIIGASSVDIRLKGRISYAVDGNYDREGC